MVLFLYMNVEDSLSVNSVLSAFRSYSAHILLVVSIGVLGIVYLLGLRPFIGIAVGVFAGSLLAVILKLDFDITNYRSNPPDWRIGWSIVALYVTATIVIYRPVLRTRPVAQYLLFGVVAGSLAYQIYRGQNSRHIVPQLLIFAFITYWSSQFAFPVGIQGPDTFAFVPASQRIAQLGHLPPQIIYRSTPLHLLYVAESTIVTNGSVQLNYYLGSIASLLIAVMLVATLSEIVPGLNRRTALFASLVFATSGFTLQRGMYPTKLNFFKPLILIGIYAAYLSAQSRVQSRRFLLLLLVSSLALVFGHTYSMGITMVIVGALFVFSFVIRLTRGLDYSDRVPSGSMVPVAMILVLILFGYALTGKTGIIGRLQGILFSVIAPLTQSAVDTAGGSSGGRYAELSLSILLFSTLGQALLFGLGVLGGLVMIRRREWGYDSILFWIVGGVSLIGFSLLFNAVDIPTPRIYTLLVMFGLNISLVVGVYSLAKIPRQEFQAIVAGLLMAIFAISALASPVAGVTMSPVGDEIPHFRNYKTNQDAEAQIWGSSYLPESAYRMQRATTTSPLLPGIDTRTANLKIDSIKDGRTYEYTELAKDTGLILSTSSTGLGGRRFVFVSLPNSTQTDNVIYQNGESQVYIAG